MFTTTREGRVGRLIVAVAIAGGLTIGFTGLAVFTSAIHQMNDGAPTITVGRTADGPAS